MELLLDTIRAAVAADATAEVKASGASACRTILAALEAKQGEPLRAATPSSATHSIVAAVSMLRGVPVDQLLDLAITRLRAALPESETAPSVQGLNVPLVAVPQLGTKP